MTPIRSKNFRIPSAKKSLFSRAFPLGLVFGAAACLSTRASDRAVPIPWLQENLAQNPDFEDLAEDGRQLKDWTVNPLSGGDVLAGPDSSLFLKGARSLKLQAAKSGRATALSSLIPVEGGALYFFSSTFRQEGFNSSGKLSQFEGASASLVILWFGADQKQVGRSAQSIGLPYGPSPWDLRDILEKAPENARFARIQIGLSNSPKEAEKAVPSTLWIDSVQLRKYLPPPTPDWAKGKTPRMVEGAGETQPVLAFFQGSDDPRLHSRGGTWSKIVTDPDAERGSALQAPAGITAGIMSHTLYFPALPPGLYRLRARVKIPPTSGEAPVGYVDVTTLFSARRQMIAFTPSREKPGIYQEIEGDFILRDAGWWCLVLHTHGQESWSIDSLKVFPLEELADQQLLSIYPGSAGEIAKDLMPEPFQPVMGGPRKPMKGLIVAGFGYDFFHVADAFRTVHRDAELKAVWSKMNEGVTKFIGFPEEPRELFQYSVIFLCDVSMRSMPLKYKNAIREYVRRGGALVVLGGHQAYERGGWKGSLLEEALPIEVAPTLEPGFLGFPKGGPVTFNPDIPWLKSFANTPDPVAYYLHRATVKPSGQVLARVGDHPFLVVGAYGEGRVVCLLGVPLGDPTEGQTAFWKWEEWVPFLREVLWWSLKNS